MFSIIISSAVYCCDFDFINNSRIGANIGPRFPLGKTADWSATGVGLNVNYSYFVLPQISVDLNMGVERWGNKNNNDQYSNTFWTAPVMIGANYHLDIFECGFTPFFGFGFGPAFWWDSYTWSYGNYSESNSDSGTDFGYKFQAGSRYRTTSCMELLFGLSFSSYDSEPDDVNNLGAFGGISINF